VRKDVL
jgi:hypothetical protein